MGSRKKVKKRQRGDKKQKWVYKVYEEEEEERRRGCSERKAPERRRWSDVERENRDKGRI